MTVTRSLATLPPKSNDTDGPLYVQLARTLREEIVNGVYPIGTQLPKEELLRERFSVSRFTVREALRLLREEGLVQSRQGAGTVVVPAAPPGAYAHHVMSINDLDAFATRTRLELASIKTVKVDKRLASRIGVPPGDEWLEAVGFRYVEDAGPPVTQIEYFINREFSAVGRLMPRHNGPIFTLIEDMFAVQIVEVHQEIGATVLSADLAEKFELAEGDPALEIVRIYSLSNGTIAQVTVNTHPAARFRHSMHMRRVKA